jgi:hypothetical protein
LSAPKEMARSAPTVITPACISDTREAVCYR